MWRCRQPTLNSFKTDRRVRLGDVIRRQRTVRHPLQNPKWSICSAQSRMRKVSTSRRQTTRVGRRCRPTF